MKTCHACGARVEQKFVGRADECASCHADLHCCKNCRFYDERVGRACREPQAEPPRDKDRANFCDYFEFETAERGSVEDESEKAKAAFDALFSKKR